MSKSVADERLGSSLLQALREQHPEIDQSQDQQHWVSNKSFMINVQFKLTACLLDLHSHHLGMNICQISSLKILYLSQQTMMLSASRSAQFLCCTQWKDQIILHAFF